MARDGSWPGALTLHVRFAGEALLEGRTHVRERVRERETRLDLPLRRPGGRLSQVVNARGNAIVYGYAPWGGLTSVEHYDSKADADVPQNVQRTIDYTYDLAGNLETVSDDELDTDPGTPGVQPLLYTFTYDALDRVDVATLHYMPGSDKELDSDYDRFGHRKALTLTDGGPGSPLSYGWTFNDLDRLQQATLPGAASPGPSPPYTGRRRLRTPAPAEGEFSIAESSFPRGSPTSPESLPSRKPGGSRPCPRRRHGICCALGHQPPGRAS
jgi:hypothetical protein